MQYTILQHLRHLVRKKYHLYCDMAFIPIEFNIFLTINNCVRLKIYLQSLYLLLHLLNIRHFLFPIYIRFEPKKFYCVYCIHIYILHSLYI